MDDVVTDATGATNGHLGSSQSLGRVVHDSMGEVRVPDGARWGAQTERARRNFVLSDHRLPRLAILAFGLVKREAALVNDGLDDVPQVTHPIARAIVAAAEEVRDGVHDDQFPVDVYQSGSGTSWNMNANEVIAQRASERSGLAVHPNDHVNASQSSNDVVPTVVRLSAALGIRHHVILAAQQLERALADAATRHAHVVKSGRTHLADAVPLTLGQELSGHSAQISEAIERLEDVVPRLCRLPLGGTAVGTGLNCPPGFAQAVTERLGVATGLPVVEAPNHFAVQGAHDAVVEASASLRGLAIAMGKIAADLRLLSSGPMTGFGEVRLPALQPGSSIMPGKVNPVVPEAVLQVAARVVGNDATAAWAAGQGELDLGAQVPVLGHVVWDSIDLLTRTAVSFAVKCIAGLDADVARAAKWAAASPALVTALAPRVGYEPAARAVKHAAEHGTGVLEAVVELELMEEAEAARILDPARFVDGGLVD
jgi:fumarate hydratase, class II